MNNSWTKEFPREGHYLAIRSNQIEYSRYELPSTRHSAGTTDYYDFADLETNQNFKSQLISVFGSSIVNEMKLFISKIDQYEPFQKEKNYYSEIENYFNKIPTKEIIESQRFNTGLPKTLITLDKFKKYGLIYEKESEFNFQVFDEKTNNYLFKIVFEKDVQISYVPNTNTLVVGMSKQLYFILRNNTVKVIEPFKRLNLLDLNFRPQLSILGFDKNQITYCRFISNELDNKRPSYDILFNSSGEPIQKQPAN